MYNGIDERDFRRLAYRVAKNAIATTQGTSEIGDCNGWNITSTGTVEDLKRSRKWRIMMVRYFLVESVNSRRLRRQAWNRTALSLLIYDATERDQYISDRFEKDRD